MRILWILLMVLLLSSCNSEKNNYTQILYKADFEASMIEELINKMKEISNRNGMTIREKNRDNMKYLSNGKEAFALLFFYNDDWIMTLSNAGFGVILNLSFYNYGKMPQSQWQELQKEILETITTYGASNVRQINDMGQIIKS